MVSPLRNLQALGALHSGNLQTTFGVAICTTVAGVMSTAMFVQDLGFLNVVNGAISLGAFVALAPSLIGLYLLGPRSSNPYWRVAMYSLIVVGIFMSILGLALSDNFAPALRSA